MKKKQLNNRLLLNKKTISSLEMNIKGGQKPTNTSHNACEPQTVVHTCNYSDLRTCAAGTWSLFHNCETQLC